MRDSVDFKTAPTSECRECLGPKYNAKRATTEARITIAQLIRLLGEPPEGSSLVLKTDPHDVGDYPSIEFRFDNENDAHIDYGCRLENEWPERWDDEAFDELLLPENR